MPLKQWLLYCSSCRRCILLLKTSLWVRNEVLNKYLFSYLLGLMSQWIDVLGGNFLLSLLIGTVDSVWHYDPTKWTLSLFPLELHFKKTEWLYPESFSPFLDDLVIEIPVPESSFPLGPGSRMSRDGTGRHKETSMPSLFHMVLEAQCYNEINRETGRKSKALPLGKQPPRCSTGRM